MKDLMTKHVNSPGTTAVEVSQRGEGPLSPLPLTAIDHSPRTRVVFQCGAVKRLGELAVGLGASRVLLVSDPGIVASGHVQRAQVSLQEHDLEVLVFDGARENPTTDDVDHGVAVAQPFAPDLIVGLGGGSSMDCAKGINFLLTNGGRMHDYWGVDKATLPMLPLITIPTTSGTGSEMQSFALISDAQTHVKMACGDKKTASKIAILDPELTLTQPAQVTALTAVDALSHAIETFVTTRRTLISQMYSRESFRLLSGNIQKVFQQPEDLVARAAMQLGASLAGLAIENSMLGAAHALANPLTANFGTAHGQAVGMMLPHVVRFNAARLAGDYQDLMRSFDGHFSPGVTDSHPQNDDHDAANRLAAWLESILAASGFAVRLSELGIQTSQVAELGQQAAKQWTGTFNPRPVDAHSLTEIYRAAL